MRKVQAQWQTLDERARHRNESTLRGRDPIKENRARCKFQMLTSLGIGEPDAQTLRKSHIL
jgi:hypothetical protein